MEPWAVLATATDPAGRLVVLDAHGWDHILADHREMASHRGTVLAAVAAPDYRRADPRPGRERFYRRDVGPSRWCLVVVDFTVAPARVVTAFGTRRDPPDWPAPARDPGGIG